MRLPIHFFMVAAVALAGVGVGSIFVMPAAVQVFYQPRVLALVHTLTLGVITAAMMGAMYRYVPALAHRPIALPRLALPQWVIFVIGTSGMISHFAIMDWVGLWWSAAAVLLATLIFAIGLLPTLRFKLSRDATEAGFFLAIVYLLGAGAIGLLMGLGEAYGFIWADLPRMLSSHIVFAAIGWVTLSICAMSYRLMPAFLLPAVKPPAATRWQVYALAVSVAGLGLTLLLNGPGVAIWAAAVILSLAFYLGITARLAYSHRTTLDWRHRHIQAGAFWLLLAIALGAMTSFLGGWSLRGTRFAAAMAVAGLLGWVTNFIIGMSYPLFPGVISDVRQSRGWPVPAGEQLSIRGVHPTVFLLYNGAVILIVIACLAVSPIVALVGSCLLAMATVAWSSVTVWILSFAYRRSLPRAKLHLPYPAKPMDLHD